MPDGSGMRDILLVAGREFRAQRRSKAFVIGLLIGALVLAGIIVVPQLLASDDRYRVGLVGEESQPLAPVLAQLGTGSGVQVETTSVADEDEARTAVADGEVDAAIVEGRAVLTDGELDPQLEALVQGAHRAVAIQQQLVAGGLDQQQARRALQVAPLELIAVGADTREDGARDALAFLTVLVLYFLIFGSATVVAVGVVEEKGSRIVEILLVAVRPWQLLAGKIAAFLVLGLIQLVVFGAAGIGAAAAVGQLPDLPPGTPGILAGATLGFVLGFLFYAAVAAATAALVSRQEELNSVLTPMTMVILASFFVGIWAANSPDAVAAKVISMVPPFAAMVMPVRVAAADVALWQVAVAVVGMLAATAAVLTIGARIYERAVLRTGARVPLTEAWRTPEGPRSG